MVCGGCYCAPGETCKKCPCHKNGKMKTDKKKSQVAGQHPEPPSVQAARKQLATPTAPPLTKLSAATQKHRYFCLCRKCWKGYENDVNTWHPRCPDCGQLMENRPLEEIQNFVKKYGKESANER